MDTQAQMYIDVSKLLTQNGFNHYEISNFAISNFESKHNLNYWNCNTYYGFGCGASGLQSGNNSGIISEHFAREWTFPRVALCSGLGGGVEVPGGK